MDVAMKVLWILGGFFLVSIVVMVIAAWAAPEGFEDDRGFHFGGHNGGMRRRSNRPARAPDRIRQ
jgi:hypothetical protein